MAEEVPDRAGAAFDRRPQLDDLERQTREGHCHLYSFFAVSFGTVKKKCSSALDRSFGPHSAPVRSDYPLDRGQADAGAVELLG